MIFNIFHCSKKPKEILYILVTCIFENFPPHLRCVSTLPCITCKLHELDDKVFCPRVIIIAQYHLYNFWLIFRAIRQSAPRTLTIATVTYLLKCIVSIAKSQRRESRESRHQDFEKRSPYLQLSTVFNDWYGTHSLRFRRLHHRNS